MEAVNLYEAKTNLSQLVERAAAGEEIVIAKSGRPLARLVPLGGSHRKPPEFGFLKDEVWVADHFDAPMDEEFLAAFDGKSP